jgi:hypothetical protein
MSIKKYKTLKSISTILNLNDIFKSSPFFCFIQVKHLNHSNWLVLKQLIRPLNLNIFISKNALLQSRSVLSNLPKYLWDNLNNGNLAILYSNKSSTSSIINRLFTTDQFLKKIKIFPLIFYFLGKFLFFRDFLRISKFSKNEAFYNLIYTLQHGNYYIANKLILCNKLFLCNLNFK